MALHVFKNIRRYLHRMIILRMDLVLRTLFAEQNKCKTSLLFFYSEILSKILVKLSLLADVARACAHRARCAGGRCWLTRRVRPERSQRLLPYPNLLVQ